MAYVDPNTIHNPATGTVAPATWGDVLRDDLEFLISPPACSVYDTTGQTLTTATSTVINHGSENYDNDAMHSTVSNTSRITAQTAGRYLFIVTVEFAANATGLRQVFFYKNNVSTGVGSRQNATTTFNAIFQASATIILAAGDYVEIQAYQSSGGNLNCTPREFAAVFLTR